VKKNLVLLGMMTVGKTTLGKIVAKNLGLSFIDTDKHIEKKNSMSVKEIFEKKGEKFFRLEEKREINKILKKNEYVISLGGGAFIDKSLRNNVLRNSISIWLDLNIKILSRRSKWNKKRPLLKKTNNFEIIRDIYEKRKNIYKMANHKILCDNLTKKSIASMIEAIYEKY
jgi:shikimate kinase